MTIREMHQSEYPLLENFLYEAKSIDNIMIAIEQGIITSTTKKRLADLENQRDDLVLKIHAEQCKLNNQINREDVISYLSQVIKHRPQLLIFSFVKKVVLYEDKVEISYNYSEYPPPSDNNPENEQKYFYDFRSNKICPSPPQQKRGKKPIFCPVFALFLRFLHVFRNI